MNKTTITCTASYLAAIVAANGLVSAYGQAALPFTAFVLIPFDLVARDVLHEQWRGRNLWAKMAILVLSGSLISFVTTIATIQVAAASSLAFLCAGVADVVIYHLLDRHSRFIKMNGSNSIAAIVDSVVFPLVAFGSIIFTLSAAQALSKFIGGFIWTLLFLKIVKGSKE